MSSNEPQSPAANFRLDSDNEVEPMKIESGPINIQTEKPKEPVMVMKPKKPIPRKPTSLRFFIRDGTFKQDHDWFGK